jgi:serine/threonine-protein kinase
VVSTPSPPPIPGEVVHRPTGQVPQIDPDDTPAAILRGKPAKGLTPEWRPAFTVVAVLLVVGLVMGILLWASARFGTDSEPTTTTIAAASDEAQDTGEQTETEEPTAPVGPASIATVTAYDPAGDGAENDADAVFALADGDPATAWSTVCYQSQFMGAKPGVGLVVSFDDPAQDAITVDVLNGPYQLAFFASDAETIPATLDGWGAELGPTAFAGSPGTVVSPVPSAPVRHMLVLLKELGTDDACTGANPFRGRLGEIAVVG